MNIHLQVTNGIKKSQTNETKNKRNKWTMKFEKRLKNVTNTS